LVVPRAILNDIITTVSSLHCLISVNQVSSQVVISLRISASKAVFKQVLEPRNKSSSAQRGMIHSAKKKEAEPGCEGNRTETRSWLQNEHPIP
jgi:hypothetical protein